LLTLGKQIIKRQKDFQISNQEEDLVKFSADGKFMTTIYRFNADTAAYKQGNFTATIPFQNTLNWTIYQDKLIVKEDSGNTINVFFPNGKLEKTLPFPIKKEKVSDKDIDDWEKEVNSWRWIQDLIPSGRGNVKYWKKRLPFPQFKPNSEGRMWVDSKGNIYIRQFTGYQKKDALWYRINLQSGKTDIVKFKAGEELSLIWKNYFIFSKTDEEEDTETITKLEETELQKWLTSK
jgi:hypothetical protein